MVRFERDDVYIIIILHSTHVKISTRLIFDQLPGDILGIFQTKFRVTE